MVAQIMEKMKQRKEIVFTEKKEAEAIAEMSAIG